MDVLSDSASSPNSSYAVLGAAGGLGSAVARRLAASGAAVWLGGRDRDRLEPLAAETGGTAVEVDGREFEAVEGFLEAANEGGGLAGVVNCAGSLLLKPAHLTTREELDATLGANLVTAFATVRAAARVLRRDGGSVVLVSSAAAEVGLPNHEAIAAAKAGVAGLVRSAAASYASRGLRVNAIAPGLMDTPLVERILGNERAREASLKLHAVRRPGDPAEVAAVVVWLLGAESGWVTGQVWGVDGGLARLKSS